MQTVPARAQGTIEGAPYDRWLTPEGDVVALFHRTPLGFLLRFPERADFEIDGESLQVTCMPAPEASPQLIFDLFHNQVAPLIRNRRGELVLHASAVAAPSGVLGFVGGSGYGKSTLAARLALAGNPFLTDDGLVVQPGPPGYTAFPERAYLRLWSDSDEALLQRSEAQPLSQEKTLVDAGPSLPFQSEPAPVRFVYLLGTEECETASIQPLNPARALAHLIRHAFILDVDDRPRLHSHFERLAAFAESIPCFSLDFPRRYEELPRVTEAILAHAADGATAA